MELAEWVQLVAPHQEVSVWWNEGGVVVFDKGCCWYLVLERLFEVVAEVHACHVDGVGGGVVKLYPVVLLEILVHINGIGCAHLVDLHRTGVDFYLFVGTEWLVAS